MGKPDGFENSSTIIIPPSRITLFISERPFTGSEKFLTPNATIATSKTLSSKGIFSESPVSQFYLSRQYPFLLTFSLADLQHFS